MKQPLPWQLPLILKLLLPLVMGVILAFYTGVMVSFSVVLSLLGLLFFLSLPVISRQIWFRSVFAIVASIFFVLLGIFLVTIQTNRLHETYFSKVELIPGDLFQVELIEHPEIKDNSVKCFAEIRAVNGQKTMGKSLLYFQKNEAALTLRYGDLICLQTNFQEIKPNGNPKEFDYSRYLRIHDVVHQGYVKSTDWEVVGNDGNAFYAGILDIRHYLDNLLTKSGLSNSNLMVAKALILGEKESLDRETLRTYSSAGAMHVLAVSGLHVGIVMLIFSFILKPIKRIPKGNVIFILSVLMAIWFYALITGMSSSVLRATFMFSFVIIGKEMEREGSVYQSILVSAFILILIEPFVIFQVGFQLSYLAVFGIVYLQPKIYNLFFTKYYFLDKIWQISSVSIAAQFATFPLGLYYFHQFPNFFMISNLIVIPLAFAILIVGLVYFFVIWIPLLDRICFVILDFLLTILNKGVKWIEDLPYSIYWGVSIEWYEVFWLYFILITGAGAFILRKTKWVITTLAATVVLLCYNVGEKYYLEAVDQLVIYNVNKSLAIDLFYGRNNTFIADQELIVDQDKLLFHVQHNWFYRTGMEEANQVVPFTESNAVITVGKQTLYVINNALSDSIPKTDLVYLEMIDFVPAEIIADWKARKTKIILGNSLKNGVRSYLLKNIEAEQVHNLREDGAFELEIH